MSFDCRFELDMLLESTVVTAQHVTELVEHMQKHKEHTGGNDKDRSGLLSRVEDLSGALRTLMCCPVVRCGIALRRR